MAIDELPVARWQGYDFLGWYTEPDGGEMITSAETISDTTYYAHWRVRQVTAAFDVGDSNYVSVLTKHTGETLDTLPDDPTKTGYIFTGWYTEADGGEQIDASTIMPGQDTVYYAHWEKTTE